MTEYQFMSSEKEFEDSNFNFLTRDTFFIISMNICIVRPLYLLVRESHLKANEFRCSQILFVRNLFSFIIIRVTGVGIY